MHIVATASLWWVMACSSSFLMADHSGHAFVLIPPSPVTVLRHPYHPPPTTTRARNHVRQAVPHVGSLVATTTSSSSLNLLPALLLGDVASSGSHVDDSVVTLTSPFLPLSSLVWVMGGMFAVTLLVVFTAAPMARDLAGAASEQERGATSDAVVPDENKAPAPRQTRRVVSPSSSRERAPRGVDRRGTLVSLVGGAMSLAVRDGGRLFVSSGTVSTVYGAPWSGLYQRVAAAVAQHEYAAVASPELVAWIAQSPAALLHPELRAWMAAQRAFHTSRHVVAGAAVALEEVGVLATTGSVAVAAAAAAKNQTAKDETTTSSSLLVELEDCDSDSDGDADVLLLSSTDVVDATTNPYEATDVLLPDSTTTTTTRSSTLSTFTTETDAAISNATAAAVDDDRRPSASLESNRQTEETSE